MTQTSAPAGQFERDRDAAARYQIRSMPRSTLRPALATFSAAFAALAVAAAACAEPIPVPPAFIALSKPLPADWKSQRFIVVVTSPATGGKAARVRVEKSSGDTRADKIGVDYVSYLLNLKPNLRAKNAVNQLDFPLIVDAAAAGARPIMKPSAPGEVVYQAALKGYDISPPEWPRNGDNFGAGGPLVVRVVFAGTGKVDQVSLLKSSGSDFIDGVVTRWAQSHWRCAPDKAGTAMIVPIAGRVRRPGNLQGGHKPFNVDPRNAEPSVGRAPTP